MSARESTPAIRLRFVDAELREVLAAASDAVATLRLTANDSARLNIVVEELVTNQFEHGDLARGGVMELDLACDADQVRLILSDSGKPFDPTRAPADSAIPERGGGAGLSIVRRWVHQMAYIPGPPHNRLSLSIVLNSSIHD